MISFVFSFPLAFQSPLASKNPGLCSGKRRQRKGTEREEKIEGTGKERKTLKINRKNVHGRRNKMLFNQNFH